MDAAGLERGEKLEFDTAGFARGAYRAVASELQQPDALTAFVANDDTSALAGIAAAHALGRRVPQDVSFVGIGDAVHRSTKVRLTTVSLDPELIGRGGVELLQRRLAEPLAPFVHQVVPVSLVTRDTTASPAW